MKKVTKQVLCLLLVAAMLAGFAVPVNAVHEPGISFKQVDNSSVSANLLTEFENHTDQEPQYADTDMVRVSVILEKQSTIEAGYSTQNIAQNAEAMAYRAELQRQQTAMTASIEKATGNKLDVVWNLTLAANIISANVPYGQIEAIEKLQGVEKVLIENQYQPDVVSSLETTSG